ncbi:CGNR zinc finger domain-containing protein [Planotetraspora phitsanulokensis]|uniref:Zinc finger CGNR domain-containing protein n=1 Tax=Planotetraspora phitsanulokensis TaxID=575192 RepID=A0A8J3XIX8_9ACTN|nr:CGNR zinc finger domain-containing protein [Planotetraspora phitsanulokensis]GII41406.1 hypothetical protein Pph01_64090 [Planotetraspora phitsanulokensis]
MAPWHPAPGEDGSVALALINSRHSTPATGMIDDLPSSREIADWLRARGLVVDGGLPLGPIEVIRLHELRNAARCLFVAVADGSRPWQPAMELVNELVRAVPVAPVVEWPVTGPVKVWHAEREGFDAVLAHIARDAVDVITGPRAPTIRRCESPRCVRIFLREHARRVWCSTTCGDRARADRHYRIQRAGRDG